jgi:hypothetical protein
MPTSEPPRTRPALVPDTQEEESPAAPAIPSFASLRAPRARSVIDLLVPGGDPVPPATAPARAGAPAPAAAPRPAEYADLLRFGVRVARVMAGMPLRAAEWAVREPVHCLRRLLGG